jgi:small neutral amino acid transporter SnatA (MarC family)
VKDFFAVLPLAIVMSAGPQIITAVFLATSKDAKRTLLAFLAGVAAATTVGVTVF